VVGAHDEIQGRPNSGRPVELPFLLLLSATISFVATPLARRLALRIGAVDEPDARRVHAAPMPRLGGLAVAAGMVGAIALATALGAPRTASALAESGRILSLCAGALAIVVVGAVDDVRGVSPTVKLSVQILAAGVAFAGGYRVLGVTNPFTDTYLMLGGAGALLTVLWIVAITNSFNLVDGLDGLAAGLGIISGTTLLAIAWIEGRPETLPFWSVLVGALAGFLVHNFTPASIFLGDSGSLLVGFLIALLALQALEKSATAVVLLASVLAVGLPIADTWLTVVRRTTAGGLRGVFRADRAHLHHRMLDGVDRSQRRAVLALYAIAVGCSAIALFAALSQSLLNATLAIGAGAIGAVVVRYRLRRARDLR
jgi:UDP-GlcNAc:undecaprenyl-phosphate/decaprenyl-phosphate GlcNAc-1-phosphate transferase